MINYKERDWIDIPPGISIVIHVMNNHHSPPIVKLVLPTLETLRERVITKVTKYTKPVEISHFSYDEERRIHLDRSQLKQYRPAVDFYQHSNLRAGFQSFIRKPDDLQEYLDALLLSVQPLHLDWTMINVTTWRGIITKILCTPFSKDRWCLYGNYRKGTIFLVEKKESDTTSVSLRHREFMYGGFKFENLCMVPINDDDLSMEERQKSIVNNKTEFGIVFKSTLGGHHLLLGAEVDGLDEHGKEYIELKTTVIPESFSSWQTFYQKKLMKWWAQSYLGGISNILVGYRERSGWVNRLEMLPTSSIPRMARERATWDPQLMLAFGDLFLTWLRQIMDLHYDHYTTFTITFDPTISPDIILEFDNNSGNGSPIFINDHLF